ncbi:MAG: nucleotidyltransferase [Oligoflexia bacterium]|nr:nucleotidyltransferase [Oligoflexia bacterium]
MTPLRTLKQAVKIFEKRGHKYCLVGGHAASLYRSQERLTRDVDFALLAEPPANSRELAEKIIVELGLTPMVGFIPLGPQERARKAVCLITSTPARGETNGIIDILLPELPWLSRAVERSQHNRIDLGFARVPVITPEDLVLAKCYALNNSPDRFQDLDDLKEIFLTQKDIDLSYVNENLIRLDITIPDPIRKFVPKLKI